MDFLPQQNRRVSEEPLGNAADILAGGKHVVVIGGGDTGSDCIGTSFRQGALSVTQLEIMPAPPEHENKGLTWPNWPLKMRTSSSQAEGARREFAVLTQKFSGADGKVAKLHCVQVDDKFKPIAGSEFDLDAQLVLLAMGFVHPVHEGLLKTLGVDLDPRGNVRANTARLSDLAAEGVLRRRHAPRTVAGGVGDPRGPALRARDRSVPDGDDELCRGRTRSSVNSAPHPEHHHRRGRARAGDVGIENVAAQRALDPEIAGQLVNQVALDRVNLVEPSVALVVERAVGEFSDRREPAAEIVIDFDGVEMRQHAGDAGHVVSSIEVVE